MSNSHKAVAVALIATIGIWGCAQGSSSSSERIRSLEAKVSRLEDDFKAATAARDQYKKKLTDAEETIAQLQKEVDALQVVVKERDDLRLQRDHVTAQFDGFRKNLRDLLGQMDAAATKPPTPVVTPVSRTKRPNS